MKILVAEDDPVSLHMIRALVEKIGFEAIPCLDGELAWSQFQKEPAEIILIDWEMPRLNGIELCRKIQAESETMSWSPQKIMLTSRGEKEDLLEAMQAGANDYLIKPVDRAQLFLRLQVAQLRVEASKALSLAS